MATIQDVLARVDRLEAALTNAVARISDLSAALKPADPGPGLDEVASRLDADAERLEAAVASNPVPSA